MNYDVKSIMEMLFNVFYLVVIWIVVYMMYKGMSNVSEKNKNVAKTFALSFLLLALGDTGHVGFRVVGYLKKGLQENAALLGYGKLITALTVTVFYMLFIKAWKERYNKEYNLFTYLLFIAGIARLVILVLPGNQWASYEAPFRWAIYRNIPLMVLGLGAAYLFFKDSLKSNDNIFKWIAIMILISYGFYTPVILLAHIYPLIGLLMIPKTLAYMAAAFIVYEGFFKKNALK